MAQYQQQPYDPDIYQKEPDDSLGSASRAEKSAETSTFLIDLKEHDRWLPISNVARIMKAALPENAKIGKEAKECMQECVSEFISFVTNEASERIEKEKRKVVLGEDVLWAFGSVGLENYEEALKIYLRKYRKSVSKGQTLEENDDSSAALVMAFGPQI